MDLRRIKLPFAAAIALLLTLLLTVSGVTSPSLASSVPAAKPKAPAAPQSEGDSGDPRLRLDVSCHRKGLSARAILTNPGDEPAKIQLAGDGIESPELEIGAGAQRVWTIPGKLRAGAEVRLLESGAGSDEGGVSREVDTAMVDPEGCEGALGQEPAGLAKARKAAKAREQALERARASRKAAAVEPEELSLDVEVREFCVGERRQTVEVAVTNTSKVPVASHAAWETSRTADVTVGAGKTRTLRLDEISSGSTIRVMASQSETGDGAAVPVLVERELKKKCHAPRVTEPKAPAADEAAPSETTGAASRGMNGFVITTASYRAVEPSPTGSISGTVTDEVTGDGIESICVSADEDDLGYWGTALTDVDGTYTVADLPAGSYHVSFSDCSDTGYVREYYDDSASWSGATTVAVAGADVPGIDAALAKGGAIAGKVTAQTGGAALGNICVNASRMDGADYASAQTDELGNYTVRGLRTGSYEVSFWDCNGTGYVGEYYNNVLTSDSAAPVSVTAPQTTSNINAALATGATISGKVTITGTTTPLENVCVEATGVNTEYENGGSTDSAGNYTVGGLPADSYVVRFSDCDGRGYLQEYYNDQATSATANPVAVGAGATVANINAGLAQGGTIIGTVTAQSGGAALADICVEAYDTNDDYIDSATTDAVGHYALQGLRTGSYVLWFQDCSDTGYLGEYYNNVTSFDAATPVSVTAGATTSGINAALALGGTISGTVTAQSGGAGLVGICVEAYDEATDFYADAVTGSGGSYSIRGLAAGSYIVSFYDCDDLGYLGEYWNNVTTWDAATPVAVATGATVGSINAALSKGGSITGRVTADAGGANLAEICVTAWDDSGDNYQYDMTGTDGTYLLGGLPAGQYTVRFSDCSETGYVTEYWNNQLTESASQKVSVAVETTTPNINAGLAVGGRITGTVTAAAGGAPLGDICVYAETEDDGPSGYGDTDASGNYVVKGLPTGDYVVSFSDCSDAGYLGEFYNDKATWDVANPVHVNVGATTSSINAGLAMGGRISGKVTAAAGGAALQYMCVYAIDAATGEYANSDSTNATGDYLIIGLAPGQYVLNFEDCEDGIYASEYWNDVATRNLATAISVAVGSNVTGKNAALAVGGHITGTVTSQATGQPIQACVSVRDADGDWVGGDYAGAGAYDVSGLATGSYTVGFEYCGEADANYAREWWNDRTNPDAADPVAVTAGATTSGKNAALGAGGAISGTITDQTSGAPLPGICVSAETSSGFEMGFAESGAGGTYSIEGLGTGSYKLAFWDCEDQGYADEYYNNVATAGEATPVAVTAGSTTTGRNAAMSATAPPPSGCTVPPFNDVPVTHTFCVEIKWMADRGISRGYPDGGFHPDESVSRMAMAAFMYRLKTGLTSAPKCQTAPFNDVPVTHTFCGEIKWMADNGISRGYPDGGFHPDESVSRMAMAAFMYRLKTATPNAPACQSAPFNDVPVGATFCGEIKWMADNGISRGYPDGGFHPNESVSRMAMAAFMYRLSRLA